MSERHRMIPSMNEGGDITWSCPICGRELLVTENGMQAIRHGDFEASHYGLGVVGSVEPELSHAAQTFSAEATATSKKGHPWDREVAESPRQSSPAQGPWWESPTGAVCKTCVTRSPK